MSNKIRAGAALLAVAMAAGCARRAVTMELHASLMYERPQISEISYSVTDERRDGGTVVLEITLLGDPGLRASFDVTPGITRDAPMSETADGRYVGRFPFPADLTGGPFSVLGRLRHENAGEVVLRDPNPLTISLLP